MATATKGTNGVHWTQTPEGRVKHAANMKRAWAAKRNGHATTTTTNTTDILTACQSLAHALVDAQLGLRDLTEDENTAIQQTRQLMYRHSVDSELAGTLRDAEHIAA